MSDRAPDPGASIAIATLPNLRELGGWPVADGGRVRRDPGILLPVIGVEQAYLAAALDEMHARFGTIEGYFTDGLGLGSDVQAALRDALTERTPA